MAVPNRSGVPEKTSQTDQYVLNYSFDEIYKILMVGLAAYNVTNNSYDRMQIDNATGGLKVAAAGGSLVPEKYDGIYPTFASTTDIYVYKLGSTTVATITVTYTDSTKATIQSVVRS